MRSIKERVRRVYSRLQQQKIIVHPLFVAFLLFCFVVGRAELVLVYTLNAVIHEVGHFVVARRMGYDFLQLRLMPYGAELFGENDQFLEFDEIKIALSGPATNFLLCLAIVASWWIFPSGYDFTLDLCVASFVLGVFNLLPVYPLDGGRILVCLLSQNNSRQKALGQARVITQIFAILLFGLFLLSIFFEFNLSLGAVAVMLFQSSFSQNKKTSYERVLGKNAQKKFLQKGIEECRLVVDENMRIIKAYRRLRSNRVTTFVVVGNGFAHSCEISESAVIDAVEAGNWQGKIKELKKIK